MTTTRPSPPSPTPQSGINAGSSTGIGAIYQSSLGKKILTGVTGLGLVLFIVAHVLGNLLLFISPNAYNQYGHKLESLGPLLWVVEGVLLLVILLHAHIGSQIYLNRRRARPVDYDTYRSAGQPSQQTLSSKTMIWTGIVLAAFIVWHVVSFKFGPDYVVLVNNGMTPVRDLYQLVVEAFQNPVYVLSYTAALILLGLHLRHGIWSALQSLGVLDQTTIPVVTRFSTAIAFLITLGFLAIPWTIYTGLLD